MDGGRLTPWVPSSTSAKVRLRILASMVSKLSGGLAAATATRPPMMLLSPFVTGPNPRA